MKKINSKNKSFKELKILMKKITVGKDYFLVLEKTILGFISHSSFMWINALYSCFLGIARHLCIANIKSKYKKQYKVYVKVAVLLILASIVYGVYNSIELFSGKTTVYHEYIAIGIAAFTFFEFGFSIKELIQVRKVHSPVSKALAYINFSSICTAFVLTQVVLTALNPEENHSFGNGLSAITFSIIILITGIVMLVNRKKLKLDRKFKE